MDYSFLETLEKDSPDFDTKCTTLRNAVAKRNITLLQLVEQLRPLLVNTNPDRRELGMLVLTYVLKNLSSTFLDERQLSTLSDFFVDKLKDGHQLLPATIKGILALLRFVHMTEEDCKKLITAIFHNISCQAQQHDVRNDMYHIFSGIQAKSMDTVVGMGSDYVYGIISAVDGERDPKNLMYLFAWMPKFFKLVNLGHLAEEAFEVMSCYFPVDFKPPTQEPSYGISRDILAENLAPCLTAVPDFGQYCLPLAIEKLDSSLSVAKLDSLELLKLACKKFEPATFIQFATQIWTQFQKELFNCTDPGYEEQLLLTLQLVMTRMSVGENFHVTLKDIIDTLKGNLIPDSKFFEKSTKFLLAISASSKSALTFISLQIVPQLENTINITVTPEKRGKLIEFLSNFESDNAGIFAMNATTSDNNELRAAGFKSLAKIDLKNDLKEAAFKNLGLILTTEQSGVVRNALMTCLSAFGNKYPEETLEFLKNLKIVKLEFYLDSLLTLTDNEYFMQFLIEKYFQFLLNRNTTEIAMGCFKRFISKTCLVCVIKQEAFDKMLEWLIRENVETNNEQYYLNLTYVVKVIQSLLTPKGQQFIVNRHQNSLNLEKYSHVFIMSGILSMTKWMVHHTYDFLNSLTELAAEESIRGEAARQLLANLLNKFRSSKAAENYFSHICEQNLTHKQITWICKGLFMTYHPLSDFWIEKLIQLLEKDKNVAPDFKTLMNDDYTILSEYALCVKNIFYQQRMLVVISKLLCDKYTPDKPQFLTALAYLLEDTPLDMVTVQFERIAGFIILSLEQCEECEVLCSLLAIIETIIKNKESCIKNRFGEFLTPILKLSTDSPFLKVRLMALQCIRAYASSGWDIFKLLPHKQNVLKTLEKCIDDKKRLVRKEAMDARLQWFLVDAPY